MTKAKAGVNSVTWARDFVESLINPETCEGSKNLHSSALEKLSAEHFKSQNLVVNFDPYSLDDDAKVDVFFSYRRNYLSVSLEMKVLAPFVKEECFCAETKAMRHCLLCR
jgi:hypothetical protein